MTYQQVVERLRLARVVVVCGPNRSGTTIGATVLADMLNLPLIKEEEFDSIDVWKFFELMKSIRQGVVQAPSMTSIVHHLPKPIYAVFMRRKMEDILTSQLRIEGATEPEWKKRELAYYFRSGEMEPAYLKGYMWEKHQRPVLAWRALDMDYESLSTHPLWVPPERRKNFGPRQTTEDIERVPITHHHDIGGEG